MMAPREITRHTIKIIMFKIISLSPFFFPRAERGEAPPPQVLVRHPGAVPRRSPSIMLKAYSTHPRPF